MNEAYFRHLVNKVKFGREDTDQHVLTLYSIALQINAKRILELGVRKGNTTLSFLLAAKEIDGVVHSVDIDPPQFNCPEDLTKFWHFHLSDAILWLDQHNNETYDLIYIDDWHSYPHVKQELQSIEHMVSPSSVILLHDLMYSGAHPHYRSNPDTDDAQWAGGGPYRAVAELDATKWEWATFPVNHGLTLLRKKSGILLT